MFTRLAVLLGGISLALAASSVDSAASVTKTGFSASFPASLVPPPSLSSTPLSVSVSCGGTCVASATGGSGTGYSFAWVNAYEESDAGGYSSAEPWSEACAGPTSWSIFIEVTVWVTDSTGAMAKASTWYWCG